MSDVIIFLLALLIAAPIAWVTAHLVSISDSDKYTNMFFGFIQPNLHNKIVIETPECFYLVGNTSYGEIYAYKITQITIGKWRVKRYKLRWEISARVNIKNTHTNIITNEIIKKEIQVREYNKREQSVKNYINSLDVNKRKNKIIDI